MMYYTDEGSGMVTAVDTFEEVIDARVKGRAVAVRTYRGTNEVSSLPLSQLQGKPIS